MNINKGILLGGVAAVVIIAGIVVWQSGGEESESASETVTEVKKESATIPSKKDPNWTAPESNAMPLVPGIYKYELSAKKSEEGGHRGDLIIAVRKRGDQFSAKFSLTIDQEKRSATIKIENPNPTYLDLNFNPNGFANMTGYEGVRPALSLLARANGTYGQDIVQNRTREISVKVEGERSVEQKLGTVYQYNVQDHLAGELIFKADQPVPTLLAKEESGERTVQARLASYEPITLAN